MVSIEQVTTDDGDTAFQLNEVMGGRLVAGSLLYSISKYYEVRDWKHAHSSRHLLMTMYILLLGLDHQTTHALHIQIHHYTPPWFHSVPIIAAHPHSSLVAHLAHPSLRAVMTREAPTLLL